ncbi:MAG: ABC transporter ATP-binding protein [Alphaproteobacteria bacterium]
MLLSSIATSLSSSVWPLITGHVIDALSGYSGNRTDVFNALGNMFLTVIGFWILLEIITRSQGFVAARIYPNMEADIRMNTFEYVNRHSHTYFSNNYVGSIANRLSELPKSSSIVIDFVFNNMIPLIISIIISSALFVTLKPTLSIIFAGWLSMHLIICTIAGAIAANLSKEHSESRTDLQGKIVDTLNNHLNVKLYTKFGFEVENVSASQNEEKCRNLKTLFFIERFKVILSFLALFSISTLFYLTVLYWQHDIISLGDMIFVFSTTFNTLALAWTATLEISYLFRELGVIKQALKIIKDPIDSLDSEDAKELKVKKGKIEFIQVTFKYRHNNNVFQEKTLTINGGQKIGLVGVSGSGKSTFAHLILRLFNIESGQIKIDGQDINEVSTESLRDNICLVPQEPMLFHRSVMDNIRYARLDATDKEVIDASVKANCHEFIMNLEDGYDTIVGEKGSKISGGQKQRIAIARAILKDAPILIMDEATSALDSYTEKQIQESIKYMSKNKTTVIIAHRLSTLLETDRILVFDNGTIIEDGSHRELLSKNGHFAMLWKMQTAGLLPDTL